MSDWEVQKVRREHTISRTLVEPHEVEGKETMDIWWMKEMYAGRTVDDWTQTRTGKVVQACVKCDTYKIVTEFSEISPKCPAKNWMCTPCTGIQERAKIRVNSKYDYKVNFPKRIKAFSRMLKKRHPELNSRKSRISNDIIINKPSWGSRPEIRKMINIVGYEFNLHFDTSTSQDDNEGVGRLRYEVRDISPMFDEHFRDHGHRGGILKRNR